MLHLYISRRKHEYQRGYMAAKILIVDDEYANRFLLEQVLSEYDTTSVASAADMWQHLSGNPVDMILLDIMMPGQDGFETARALRENREYADIPVIFVTARREAEDLAKGFDLGGYDYIKKPFDETELLARVKSVIKKKKEQMILNEFALKDTITGMYNRRFLDDYIQRESDRINRGLLNISAAMLDIDHFKKTNDTYGHLCGDYLLKNFSRTIISSLRTYDIAVRYGGEEFLILFPHLNKNEAANTVERLRDIHRSTEYTFDNYDIAFTFSAGIADSSEFKPGPSIMTDIIQRADSRLYTAKDTGRDRVVFE